MATKEEIKKFVGERIRAARQRLGITQAQLGQKVGKTASVVSAYETGLKTPHVADLPAIAEALSVSIFALLPKGNDEVDRDFQLRFERLSPAAKEVVIGLIASLERYENDVL